MTEQPEAPEAAEASEADVGRARRVDGLVWALDRPEVRPSRPERVRRRLYRWRAAAFRRRMRRRPRQPSKRWFTLRWWEWLGVVVMVVAVVASNLVGTARDRGWLPSVFGDDPPAAAAPPVPGTVGHPFAGSPARTWANGAHGITLSGVKPVGGVPKAAVSRGMRLTKKFLVAANLDRDVLAGGSPDQALGLLAQGGPTSVKALRRSLAHPTADDSPLGLFTRFDTDEVRLVGHTVKVRGRMTLEQGRRSGTVVIRADYTFVYPVAARHGHAGKVARTVVRRVLVVPLTFPDGKSPKPGELPLLWHKVSYANGGCSPRDGLLHPTVPAGRLDLPGGTRPPLDPYVRTLPLPPGGIEAECRALVNV